MTSDDVIDERMREQPQRGREDRCDWLMRQFVEETVAATANGRMTEHEARGRLYIRGVPRHVQQRLLTAKRPVLQERRTLSS